MATFSPPVGEGALVGDPRDRHSWPLHRFYGAWATGFTVWQDSQGVWHEDMYPYLGGAASTVHDGSTSTYGAPDEGLATALRVYQGGHVHEIDAAEQAALIAAGYRDNIVPDNLLIGTDGTFEDGALSGQTSGQSTLSVSAEQAHSGSFSMKSVATSSGTVTAFLHSFVNRIPVVVGETITLSAWVRHQAGAGRIFRLAAQFFDSSGVFVGSVNGTLTSSLVAGEWHHVTGSLLVPSGVTGARANVQMTGSSIADVLYVDDVYVVDGTVPYDPSSGWVD